MSTGVGVVDGVVITVAILVQAVDGVGVEVGGVVRRNKSAPFGGVIPGVTVVQAGIFVVVVATVADGVGFCYSSIAGNGAIAPHLYSTMICASSQEKATQVIVIWEAFSCEVYYSSITSAIFVLGKYRKS